MNVCSAVLEPNICPGVLIHLIWPGAKTEGEKKTRCSHKIPKWLKYLTQQQRGKAYIDTQHKCTLTQSWPISKSEVTPPPGHARNIQRAHRRAREKDWERDIVSEWDVTCLPVYARIIQCPFQVQKHIYNRNAI